MDLTWSRSEEAFRAEARDWLAAQRARPPLPSGDTREGFAAHLEWERTLLADAVVGGVLAASATAAGTPRCGSG